MEMEKLIVERLDVDNYAVWETRMKFLLITKGLWAAVEGGDDVTPEADKKALALIGLHVKEHHLTTLKRCGTAREAWLQLEAVYQAKSNAKKLQLKKDLAQLKMRTDEPLTKFAARATDIQDQLRAAGHEISDQEVAWAVLAGLPTDYDMMVTVLTATETNMKLEDILPKLLQVEQQRQKYEAANEKALIAKRNGYGVGNNNRSCFYCGKVGHLQRGCKKKMQDEAAARGGKLAMQMSAIAL